MPQKPGSKKAVAKAYGDSIKTQQIKRDTSKRLARPGDRGYMEQRAKMHEADKKIKQLRSDSTKAVNKKPAE